MDAGQYVQTIEHRQGFKIACLEEIAFNQDWLSPEEIKEIAKPLMKNTYGEYLLSLLI